MFQMSDSFLFLLCLSIRYGHLGSSRFNQPLRFLLPSVTAVDLFENKVVWLKGVKRSWSNAVIDWFLSILSLSVFLRPVKHANRSLNLEVQHPLVIGRYKEFVFWKQTYLLSEVCSCRPFLYHVIFAVGTAVTWHSNFPLLPRFNSIFFGGGVMVHLGGTKTNKW